MATSDLVPTLITAALRRRIADESRPYADRLEDLAKLASIVALWSDVLAARAVAVPMSRDS